jgi:Na+-transporting NADH:ubiquinone oxidoreductase subunit D
MNKKLEPLLNPLLGNNPVTVQMLGICSALAVTTNMKTAVTMSIAVIAVMIAASAIISAIRHHIPDSIRLILQITIIASLVIVIDQILQAWFYDISKVLSIFVSLIVTNCLVMGRAEGFAMHHEVKPAVLDALGNALGYSLILLLVAFIRELFGLGTLFGAEIFQTVESGGWYEPMDVMQKAPSAFFIIGLIIWLLRSIRPVSRDNVAVVKHHPVAATGTADD